MKRRTAVVGAALARGAMGVPAAPTAVAADVTVELSSARLEANGTVTAPAKLRCPAGSSFTVGLGISQLYEANGGYYDTGSTSGTPARGVCTGTLQRIELQAGEGNMFPFMQDLKVGPKKDIAGVTEQTTSAHVYVAVESGGVIDDSASFEEVITLR